MLQEFETEEDEDEDENEDDDDDDDDQDKKGEYTRKGRKRTRVALIASCRSS